MAPYRRRTAELLEQLRIKTTPNDAERLKALAHLALKLTELVTDLKSIGADSSELQPLEKLLTELQHFLGGPHAGGDLSRLWSEAETVLHAFRGTTPATTSTARREGFWK
ncbi:MAG TPA: hypothetical protein VKE94_09080 [Gemmataceae bacterium]|nr:hypothetical protein [Gemmataceae bacterium]